MNNEKEFEEYIQTFDNPEKYRDLLWDAWVEATEVANDKLNKKDCEL